MSLKQDLFKDGRVQYIYEKGKSVTLWVSEFKVVVYKPYSCKTSAKSRYVYRKPKIALSTNTTAIMSYEEFKLIDRAILAAVQILNQEGYGLIDIKNWKPNESVIVDVDSPYYGKQLDKKITTKTFKPLPGDIFIDTNSNKWLYLGYGILYEDGVSQNREDCYFIYMNIGSDNYNIQRHKDLIEIVFHNKCSYRVDTYKTEKRGLKLLDRPSENHTIKNLRIMELPINYEYSYRIEGLIIKPLR